MERGELWWAALPDASGKAPAYQRPVLIVQDDAFNVSALNTVIVVALTTNIRLANAPGNVLITAKQSGLPKDSVINVSQLLTIDKRFLVEAVGFVPTKILQRVDDGLRLILNL